MTLGLVGWLLKRGCKGSEPGARLEFLSRRVEAKGEKGDGLFAETWNSEPRT